MELWTASRTDPELRSALLPAERRLGAALREVFDRYVPIDDPELARARFESLLTLVRGLELTRIMRQDATQADRVIEQWLTDLEAASEAPPVAAAEAVRTRSRPRAVRATDGHARGGLVTGARAVSLPAGSWRVQPAPAPSPAPRERAEQALTCDEYRGE